MGRLIFRVRGLNIGRSTYWNLNFSLVDLIYEVMRWFSVNGTAHRLGGSQHLFDGASKRPRDWSWVHLTSNIEDVRNCQISIVFNWGKREDICLALGTSRACDSLTRVRRTLCNTYQWIKNKYYAACTQLLGGGFEGEKNGTEDRHEKTGCNQHLQYANDIYHIIQRWRS